MFGMSWADTLRIVLMGIFILVCIFLTIVVLMQESNRMVYQVLLVVLLILTGVRIKVVQWKVSL